MLCRPGQAQRAAVEQHDDRRLAQGVDALQQLLLRAGQADVCAVTTGKTGHLDRHLFALQLRRQAQDHDHRLGLLGDPDRVIHVIAAGDRPQELHLRVQAAAHILELDAIHPARLQLDGLRLEDRVVNARVLGDHLAVQDQAVAAEPAGAQLVRAADRGHQVAAPAHAERAAPLTAQRRDALPGKIDHQIDALQGRMALEFVVVIVGRAQAIAARVGVGRAQAGSRDWLQWGHPFGDRTASRRIDHRARRDKGTDAFQGCDRLGWRAVVIAQQRLQVVGIGANDGDRSGVLAQGQDAALVLEQDDRLARCLQGQGTMLGRVDHRVGDLGIGHLLGRVKHAQAKARRKEPFHRAVDGRLIDQALLHRLDQCGVGRAAVEVTARFDGQGRRLGRRLDQLVVGIDVNDRPAVRDHVRVGARGAAKAPLLAEDLLQEGRAGAARLAVGAVIGAHHRHRPALAHAGLKVGQVGQAQVALAGDGIKGVPVGLGAAVHGIVLGRGHQFQVPVIVALEPLDKGHAHPRREVGALAIGLHPAPPARVPKNVDVGCPKGQPGIDLADAASQRLVVLGPRLVRDGRRDAAHQVDVPGGGQADGLREHGGYACPPHAVQALVPPVVLRDAQPLDRRGIVDHLRDLFC